MFFHIKFVCFSCALLLDLKTNKKDFFFDKMNDTMNSSSEDDRGPPPGPPPSVSPPSSPLSSPEYRIENDSVPIMGTSVRNRIQPKETPTVDPSIKDPNKFDGELTGCGGSCFCHPESACHRSIALFLMCILGFGSYFCYDNPGALQVSNRNIKQSI